MTTYYESAVYTMKTYDELYETGVKYYGDDNNCSVVSLAVACKVSYGKAFNVYKKLGRKTGKGTYKEIQMQAFRELGYKLERVHCKAKTVKTLPNHLPKQGQFIAYVRGHVLAIDDGIVKDWTDGCRHRIKEVFRVQKAD